MLGWATGCTQHATVHTTALALGVTPALSSSSGSYSSFQLRLSLVRANSHIPARAGARGCVDAQLGMSIRLQVVMYADGSDPRCHRSRAPYRGCNTDSESLFWLSMRCCLTLVCAPSPPSLIAHDHGIYVTCQLQEPECGQGMRSVQYVRPGLGLLAGSRQEGSAESTSLVSTMYYLDGQRWLCRYR